VQNRTASESGEMEKINGQPSSLELAEKILLNTLKRDTVRNPDFLKLLAKMLDIHERKNADYASVDDLYKNFRESEHMGIPAWKGIAVRLSDKFSRLREFVKMETLEVYDESIEDTLIDMANYSLLLILVRREALKEREPKMVSKAALQF